MVIINTSTRKTYFVRNRQRETERGEREAKRDREHTCI